MTAHQLRETSLRDRIGNDFPRPNVLFKSVFKDFNADGGNVASLHQKLERKNARAKKQLKWLHLQGIPAAEKTDLLLPASAFLGGMRASVS